MLEQNQREEAQPEPEATGSAEESSAQDPEQDSGLNSEQLDTEVEEVYADAVAPAVEDVVRQERDEFEERWLRSVAELDNFRKRTRRELQDVRRFAIADVMRGLLDVLDNLERALQAFQPGEEEADTDRIQAGIQMVSQQLETVLAEHGMQRIEAEQTEFDPRLHEAIQQVEVDGVPSGQVTEVVQTGYLLNDLVLRPSRVIVAK